MRYSLEAYDDTTIYFCRRFLRAAGAAECGHEVHIYISPESDLSARQLKVIEGSANPEVFIKSGFVEPSEGVIITNKPSRFLRRKLVEFKTQRVTARSSRVPVISFFAGTDFTPVRGLKNRILADALIANSEPHEVLLQSILKREGIFMPTSWYQPSLEQSANIGLDLKSKYSQGFQSVTFYEQNLVPTTTLERFALARSLKDLSESIPVAIKSRQSPGENMRHAQAPMIGLNEFLPQRKSNMLVSADEGEIQKFAPSATSIHISCCSSATLEQLGLGYQAAFLDSFPGDQNRFVKDNRAWFADPNLFISFGKLAMRHTEPPSQSWIDQHFRADSLVSVIRNVYSQIGM